MNPVSTVILLLLLLTIVVRNKINATNLNYINKHHSILKRSIDHDFGILPDVYHQNVAPMQDGHPVQVKVSVIILNLKIGSISTQDFDVDIFYHQHWNDYRLQPPTNIEAMTKMKTNDSNVVQYRLTDRWRNRLWIPNVYFRNAVSGSISNILTPTYYFTITNYTEVFMAVRLSLKLTCHMNFYKFPFDTQICYMNLTSTSDDANTMRLSWNIFRIGSHVDESEFTVIRVDHESNCLKQYRFGSYSCLYGSIVFKRNIGKYVIKRLVPSFIIVIITFIGFWIPTNISPARTALPITALLALITQQIQSDLNVSYVYALQIWNIVCIIFVFANLLEFAIALYMIHCDQELKSKKQDPPSTLTMWNDGKDNTGNGQQQQQHRPTLKRRMSQHFQTTTRHAQIDVYARYIFPLLFFLFILTFTLFVSIE
ncbi:hypothetical protein DERP_007033 [Dermatophagoides pteronyssinus]|uniref:Glycine receptor subunit alpha-2-like n=1 Tax=Dermatophagoides pteronyssinus TaxID=6956 RepID=A0ABQ8JUL7_DERPT|nr:hypothetical protein DERP_007033 [Dermatophagoides pteronyssinus]